jgi:hypothetical protein
MDDSNLKQITNEPSNQPVDPQMVQPPTNANNQSNDFNAVVSSNNNDGPVPDNRTRKGLSWAIGTILFVVLVVIFLLGILPGNTSYLHSSLGNAATSSSGTPASCTTTKNTYLNKKGFPLAYSFTIDSHYSFNCASSGQGVGQGSTTTNVSLSLVPLAKLGIVVDIISALVLAFLVKILIKKFTAERAN